MSKPAKAIYIILCILCLIALAIRLFRLDIPVSWFTVALVWVFALYPWVYNAIQKHKRK